MSNPSTTWTLLDFPVAPGEQLDRQVATAEVGVDWALDEDGDLVVPMRYTTGPEAVAQGLRIRMQNFFGEWFANLEDGVRYFEDILGHPFDEQRIRSAFRDAILATPGVAEILLLTATFDRTSRTTSIRTQVRSSFGVVGASLEV